MIHLVLGGARSGKSHFAEQQTLILAEENQKKPIYIATATAIDDEMTQRIYKHQIDRNDNWQLIECPLLLSEQLAKLSNQAVLSKKENKKNATNKENQGVYLLDCLTLWLNNQLFSV